MRRAQLAPGDAQGIFARHTPGALLHPWEHQPGLDRKGDRALCEAVPGPLMGTGSKLRPKPTGLFQSKAVSDHGQKEFVPAGLRAQHGEGKALLPPC